MARKAESDTPLPRHVHMVAGAAGRRYYYYQEHRGTHREGKRIRLPANPDSADFWAALRWLAGPGGGADEGPMAILIDTYMGSPEFLGLAPATRREYARYLGRLRALWGRYDPRGVKVRHLIALRDSMSGTPVAANRCLAAIQALFQWGVPREHLDVNVVPDVPRLDARTDGYAPWPAWALELAARHMREEMRIAVTLGYHTGQRISDVLRMRLQDVITADSTIAVRQQKTGKRLWVPIHPELAPVIEAARAGGAMFLVARRDGSPFTPSQFRAMWRRELGRPKLARIREAGLVFHGLRKGATVKLAEVGCTTRQIMSITGHSQALVEHYTRSVDQKLLAREAMRKWAGKGVEEAT